MAVELVLRNGTEAENDGFTGAPAEVTVDRTNNTLRVHDGTTAGGTSTVSVTGSQTLSNKTLDDPAVTGQVTGDLIPSDDVTFDLGSASNRWKDLFLSGNTIDIGGATISVTNGSFEFKDSGGNDAEVSLAANTTDDLSEGSSNLYYTDTRVRNAVSVSGDLSYDSATGTFSFTERTDSEVRNLFSAAGDLSYSSSTGEFSVTTYKSSDFDSDFSGKSTSDLSEGSNLYYTDSRVRNALSASGDLSYNSSTGNFSVTTYKTSDFNADFNTKDTDDLSEGLNNLYYTNGRVDSHLSGGTGVSYSSGTISIGQDVDPSSNVEFSDLVVTGDLTVQGSQTVLETATLQVEDKNIELGKVSTPSNSTANTGGITVLAGSDGDKTWKWLSATDSWTSSEHIDVISGKEYKINGNKVLDSSSLGSSVVSSSLTSVDTLNSGSISSGFGNINIGSSTFTGDGSGLTNVDAATLEGENGAHYLDYNNFTNTPSNLSDFGNDENFIKLTDLSAAGDLSYDSSTGEFSVTVPAGYDSSDFDTDFSNKTTDDLSEGENNLYYTDARVDSHLSGGSGIDYSTGTISHSNTSSQSSVDNSGNTVIQDITLDGFGHITGLSSKTIDPPTLSTLGLDTDDDVQFDSLGIGTSASGTSGEIRATGDIIAHFSDDRLKTRLGTIDSALDKVNTLEGFYYEPNDTAKSYGYEKERRVGLSAQDVQEILPEVVRDAPIGDGYLTLQYEQLVPLLVEAIKKLKTEVDDLKKKI